METKQLDKALDRTGGIVALVALLFVVGLFAGYRHERAQSIDRARKQAALWSVTPRVTAAFIIDKYGPPDRLGAHEMVWIGRKPWKRIAVRDDPPQSPLEQAVGYQLTARALKAVEDFDHGVRADAGAAELAARGNSEGLNRLALNLVDEVATGGRDAGQARDYYRKTAELSMSGKSSPYMDQLLFKPYEPFEDLWVRDFKY